MTPARAVLTADPATAAAREEAIFDRPTLFFAVALSLGVLGVYLFTLSNNWSPDSMAFAQLATQGKPGDLLFFQAEHLFYPFVGWLWYQLWVFFGYEQGALVPLQILNAAGGAVGAGLFFLSLRLLLGRSPRAMLLSVLSALTLAGTYGYWYHSTGAEDQIIANAVVLGAFLLFAVRMRETKWGPYSLSNKKGDGWRGAAVKAVKSKAFLALVAAFAILLHGTTVLFLPALLLGLWLKERDIRSVAVMFIGVVALVGITLVAVGGLAHGFRSPGDYLSWLLAAPGVGVWGRLSPRSLWIGVQTLANSVVFLQGGPSFKALLSGVVQWRNTLSVVAFLAVGALVFTVIAYAIFVGRRRAGQREIALVCLVWFAAIGLFNLYWAPEDIQFWVGLLPPLIVAASLAYLNLLQVMKYREELLNSIFVFAMATVFIINLVTAIVPQADAATNAGLYKALCLESLAKPDDLIITPGWDWASGYGPYFANRTVLSIVDSYLLSANSDRSQLFRLIDRRIADTTASGGKVYVVRLFSMDQNDGDWFKRTTGLTAGDFSFKRQAAWECGEEVVWEVARE